jgi:hypothetical protein
MPIAPPSTDCTEALLKRFAGRLNLALDALGAPASALARARYLGDAIAHDTSYTSALLNGFLMPDWNVLAKLSLLINRQPGYFLDDSLIEYPPEMKLVKPFGSGESIVFRMPEVVNIGNRIEPGSEWTYIIAKHPLGFGVLPGDYIVNAAMPNKRLAAQPRLFYLMWSHKAIELLQCVDIQSGRGVFTSMSPFNGQLNSKIIPLDTNTARFSAEYIASEEIEHIGVVAMSSRYFGDTFPLQTKPQKTKGQSAVKQLGSDFPKRRLTDALLLQ